MSKVTCADAIVAGLVDQGIDTIFGIPGGQTYEVFDAIYRRRDALRLVTGRHEQGVAYMALGYSLATGRESVYSVVPGPGVLNSSAALSTAYVRNAPVICLAGQIPSGVIGRGIGFLHDIPDQTGVLERLTKRTELVRDPREGSNAVTRAFAALRSGRPRPVAIEVPPDVLGEPVGEVVLGAAVRPAPLAPASEPIAAAARLLAASKRPMIYVGGGAIEARAEVLQLAERLQAPVVAHRTGKGIVDERRYLSQTFPAGHRLWPEVDVVLAVGTRFKYPRLHWGFDERLAIVHIDVDAEELTRISTPTVAVHADAKLALQALLAELGGCAGERSSREQELSTLKTRMRADFERIQPQVAILDVIREALGEDGILVDEITQTGYASWYAFPVYSPRTLITSGYAGNLGYGYATAVGVKVASPDRRVVAISGDGGFMFNGLELATAVKYGLNLVSIVFADAALTNVARAQAQKYGGRVIGTELVNPDFVRFAESFGAVGLRARDPLELRACLARAFDVRGPVVIEMPLGATASPWEFLLLPQVRGTKNRKEG
jgi:acetolactate synthase-1/2/3 large subunit